MELSDHNKKLLTALPEPRQVFSHLLKLTEIPRPSHHLERVQRYLQEYGNSLPGCTAALDKAGNVLIRKKASAGKENSVRIAIQGHMDMVCSKTPDKVHDWNEDPIIASVEGDWMVADRTTLGADDGIGVAAGLALLEEKDLEHGPLEILITADEETTMGGAEFVEQAPFMQAQVLINVDSEEESSVCVGCAGGFERFLYVALQREAATAKTDSFLQLTIQGLRGGHTGIDIHQGRANALQVLARLLNTALTAGIDCRIVSSDGGNAPNAIPRNSSCVLAVPTAQSDEFRSIVQAEFAKVQEEYLAIEFKGAGDAVESKDGSAAGGKKTSCMELIFTDAKAAVATTSETTRRVVSLMLVTPHGVIRMSPDVVGQVETSISFSVFSVPATATDQQEDRATLHLFARSSSHTAMVNVNAQLDSLALLMAGSGVSASKGWTNYFPGWQPDVSTNVLKTVISSHKDLFKAEPRVYAVHAGLECGLLQGRYPELKCVSIGPTIHGAHSPDEKLKVSSVKPFYAWLKDTVSRLASVENP